MRRVVLLAHEHMNILDLAGPLQAFHTANRLRPAGMPLCYELIVASETGGPVTTSAGLPVMTQPLACLDGEAIDTLVAPGGCRDDTYEVSPTVAAWVSSQAGRCRRVCSICTGAFLLAAAGQLDGRRAATHWQWADRLAQLYPGLQVDAKSIFVRDGKIWTSAGVTAGIDLTLALIEEDLGHRVAIEVARQLVVFVKRSGGQAQFSMPLAAQANGGDVFDDLHAWMAANLNADLRIEHLAARTCMAPRTFARLYRERTGQTPAKAVEQLRIERARRLLEETRHPLKRVAILAGFPDEQALRRAFVRQVSVPPGDYRERCLTTRDHGDQVIASP
ncbi:MAG: GlxA family transcriptional regulator [Luteibacter sp.]|uniref:GlxA family transcriptional regulator n=1 Tax=Luteibacter sp. TaxID=1886636 RepID=UPI002807C9F0|nr:GlxA family transcriptional regulator [Luteibacter sp.]MDQ7995223.1 GlxA family transcriptional regulator [Luteibacter sp.]